MNIVLSGEDHINISAQTDDLYDTHRHIASVTPSSVLFAFDHGWIRVEGDTVTACPYVNGKKGEEHCIDLSVLSRMQMPNSLLDGNTTPRARSEQD